MCLNLTIFHFEEFGLLLEESSLKSCKPKEKKKPQLNLEYKKFLKCS